MLSVCIPTFNRARELSELLNSLNPISYLSQFFEIVIVDGASCDDTEIVVANFKKRNAQFKIKYILKEQNGGVNIDYHEAIKFANFDFCWLMSSDDIFDPQQFAHAIKLLNEFPELDILTFNRRECSYSLKLKSVTYAFHCTEKETVHLNGGDDFFDYVFKNFNSITALFSYAPSVILKRSEYLRTHNPSDLDIFGYAHAATLLRMTTSSSTNFIHHPEALAIARQNNDSFSKDGVFARMMIDFDGYRTIGQQLALIKPKYETIVKTSVRKEHGWLRIAKTALAAKVKGQKPEPLLNALDYFKYPSTFSIGVKCLTNIPYWVCEIVLGLLSTYRALLR